MQAVYCININCELACFSFWYIHGVGLKVSLPFLFTWSRRMHYMFQIGVSCYTRMMELRDTQYVTDTFTHSTYIYYYIYYTCILEYMRQD